jgi:hypothetical protein
MQDAGSARERESTPIDDDEEREYFFLTGLDGSFGGEIIMVSLHYESLLGDTPCHEQKIIEVSK